MYFGSVKFFKQIIYSSAICGAAIMASFALMFGIKCSAQSSGSVPASSNSVKQNKEHTVDAGTLNVPEGTTISQVYLAMAAKGYTDEDIINFFDEINSEYLEDYVRTRAEELGKTGVDSNAAVYDASYIEKESLKSLYPDMYSDSKTDAFPADGNSVYLTFSGVTNENITDILDTLDAHGIKAVFFAEAAADEEVIAEISSRGHILGILCENGTDEKSNAEYIGELYTAFTKIRKAAGYSPSLFCPEDGGSFNDLISEMTRRGFSCCGNSVSAADSKDLSGDISAALETAGHAVAGFDTASCQGAEADEIICEMESAGFLICDPIGSD